MPYRVTDLGAIIPNAGSSADAVNNSGQVLFSAMSLTTHQNGYYLYQNGGLQSLPGNNILAVNDRGEVASPSANFLPTSINNAGVQAGSVGTSNDLGHAAVLSQGVTTDLGMLSSTHKDTNFSVATAINDQGQVVGRSSADGGNAEIHPFVYSGGKMTDIGLLPGAQRAGANAINNSGLIVGGDAGGLNSHAFSYLNGKLTDLGTLGGTWSNAVGVNNAGQIIGVAALKANVGTDWFLYDRGQMSDIGELLRTTKGLTISSLTSINDQGLITANAVIDGTPHALLLTPVPEPTTLALAGVIGALLLGSRIKRPKTDRTR